MTKSTYSPRRYFILSTAGKLIFTTYALPLSSVLFKTDDITSLSDEDEDEATGYVGVMQAIISIFAVEGDRLRFIKLRVPR